MEPNHYNIFLASSKELWKDRQFFAAAIQEINQELNDKKIHFFLRKWDNHSSSYKDKRKQDEYNQDIGTCDLFVMLYWSKVGQYTWEEFEFSQARLKQAASFRVLIAKKTKEVEHDKSVELFESQDHIENVKFRMEYVDGDALKLKIKEELRKLIDECFFTGVESTYKKKNYVPKSVEFEQARNIAQAGRLLLVSGISGSGKTEFTRYFLGSRELDSKWAWIDCAESTPSSAEVAHALIPALVGQEHEQAMISSLPSLAKAEIDQWFDGKYAKYLVLDDFDNLIPDNVDPENPKVHWLAANFLTKCLESDNAPFVVLIYKHPKSEVYLKKLLTDNGFYTAGQRIVYDDWVVELRHFTGSEAEKYINSFPGLKDPESLLQLMHSNASWMPIQLQIVVSEILERQKEDDNHQDGQGEQFMHDIQDFLQKQGQRTRSVGKEQQSRDEEFTSFLLNYLFQRIKKKDAKASRLMDTALASAVLQKYNKGRDPLDPQCLSYLLSAQSNMSVNAVNQNLLELKSLNLLKSFEKDGQYSFEHDTKLNFAFDKLNGGAFSPGDKKYYFHLSAADWYEQKFNRDKNSVKNGEFASWHYGNANCHLEALGLLSQIDKDMRIDFRYADLQELRDKIRQNEMAELTEASLVGDSEGVWGNLHEISDEQALNLADLAEVYFQGLDKWEKAEEYARKVIRLFEEGHHGNLNAYIQAGHLISILVFETAIDDKLDELFQHRFPSYNPRDFCVEIAEYLLAEYLNVNLKEVYNGTYVSRKVEKKTLAANLFNSLGVFLNRAEEYERAIHAYRFAVVLLTEVRHIIEENERNVPEVTYKKWLAFLERDLMCAHSNLSRSLLLSQGPDQAIEYFEENLRSWYPEGSRLSENSQAFWSSQEYNYALINISYYHLCKGNLMKARAWWHKCQEPPGEAWLKLTKEQMDLVLTAYETGRRFNSDRFTEVAAAFQEIPDSRGKLFSNFNRVAHEISNLINRVKSTLTPQQMLDLLHSYRKIADEKFYFNAAKIITHTYHVCIQHPVFIKSGIIPEPMLPHESWDADWEDEAKCCVGELMTRKGEGFAYGPWRAPMLMAGILLMRSKPFAPTRDEIEEVLRGEG
jgi:hypothetical protein